ncbi:M23 family metallopeptidase [uncultured Hymenobacter sp.]|uniref:M23 family metallopeptidase n=1 Tax=uncultured Hymenobacter sp. TaxID=170016 RepID=UPI0035CC9155
MLTKNINLKLLLALLALAAGLITSQVSGQEADTSDEKHLTLSAAAGARVAVPKGYFLFPIAPGQPNYLTGSMGELRPNHFHGGLDIKTQGAVNRPVYASTDGYVSRLKQSSFGYGNVLYITHPNGLTTVYGHLNEFRGPVAQELRRRQYAQQSYELEMFPEPGAYPVRRGEVVALSGNTGGSAGPHLHWEVRDQQDRQLNPLQWGGFPEIQDHVAPQLQAFAVEPLDISSRVNQRFEKAVLVPKVLPGPGVATVWPDTISCFGSIGLLVQGFDRFDKAWNKNGIQQVTVQVNGQPHYEHTIDRVPFVIGTRQVANFVDFQYQYLSGRSLQKLWVDAGNDLVFYTPAGLGSGRLQVEAGKVYTIDITLADSYGNRTPLRVVLRGQAPAYFQTRSAAVRKPSLRYEISRNLLKVFAVHPDTAAAGANLQLYQGPKRLEIRPSYTQSSENVYLYDLRAGRPDSLRFGPLMKRFDRQALIRAGEEVSYATAQLTLAFGPQTLFDNLYLSTAYRPEPTGRGLWTVGSALTPLYRPLRLTLKPSAAPAEPDKSAIYSVAAGGGRAYVGGKWDGQSQISVDIRRFGSFRILTDSLPPSGRLIGRPGGQLLFKVGDDLSGLASYQLLIGGRFRLLRFEHKNATLVTIAGDTLGSALRGPAELHLADQAGNKRVISLKL